MSDYISDTIDPSDGTSAYCGGNDWVPYKDEKCFKISEKLATRDEAETICNQEYFRTDSVAPTLASIKSAAEQEYLTKFIFETSGVDNNVWIGAKRRPENSNQLYGMMARILNLRIGLREVQLKNLEEVVWKCNQSFQNNFLICLIWINVLLAEGGRT